LGGYLNFKIIKGFGSLKILESKEPLVPIFWEKKIRIRVPLVHMISKTSKNQQFSRKNQWWGRQLNQLFDFIHLWSVSGYIPRLITNEYL
jgi:hypothetical protein